MLSTHFKKDAQLIAVTVDDDTDKLGNRIYFYPPSEDSESEDSEVSEEEDEMFRIPMAKKIKKRRRHRRNQMPTKRTHYPVLQPQRKNHNVYRRRAELRQELLCSRVPQDLSSDASEETDLPPYWVDGKG